MPRNEEAQLNDLTREVGHAHLAAERLFLAALWLDPIGGNNAAHDAGLCERDFGSLAHRFVFWFACTCAVENVLPSKADCVEVSRMVGEPITFDELNELLDDIYRQPDQCREGSVWELAATVKRNARERRAAHLHGLKAGRILRNWWARHLPMARRQRVERAA